MDGACEGGMHMHSLKKHSRWCSMHSWKRASWVHHPPNRQGLQWRDMLAWKSPGPGLSLLHPVLLTGGYEASYQRGALLRVIQHLLHEGTACGASKRVRVVVAGARGGVGGGQKNRVMQSERHRYVRAALGWVAHVLLLVNCHPRESL